MSLLVTSIKSQHTVTLTSIDHARRLTSHHDIGTKHVVPIRLKLFPFERFLSRFHSQSWFPLILVVFLLFFPFSAKSESNDWKLFAPDLETKTVSHSRALFFSADIFFVRTSLQRYRLGVIQAQDLGVPALDVQSLVKRTKAVMGINANFFDNLYRPLGLVISRGMTQQSLRHGGILMSGVLASTRSGVQILPKEDSLSVPALDAIQAGPLLLLQGKPYQSFRDSARERRSGVCLDASRRVILYSTISNFFGFTFQELQTILENIGCKDALNLDGGGSAQLFLTNQPLNGLPLDEISIEGSDSIPVALALFPIL